MCNLHAVISHAAGCSGAAWPKLTTAHELMLLVLVGSALTVVWTCCAPKCPKYISTVPIFRASCAACRHEFPVDTHVWRITKSLGWVPQKASRDQTYAHLNARVPDNIK